MTDTSEIRQCTILEFEESGLKVMQLHRDNKLFAGAYYVPHRDEWVVNFPGSLESYRPKTAEQAKAIMRDRFYNGFRF